MSNACLPLRHEGITARTRRVREGWSQREQDRRRQMSAHKVLELLRLFSQPNTDQDHWAAGAMTVADLHRLAN